MKLLRCYVQNYGKLSDFSYDFADDLNVILQENGWGKSTFASFLKAMLFGLPKTTKKDLDQNERAKYTPWQGGKFGGWLEFTLKSTPYRVERYFGSTNSKDKVVIYDLKTNLEITNPDFIQETLGINADTFMRSTYVAQGLNTTASDESIKAKLGKLIQNDTDFELSAVDKKLQDKQTQLKHLRGQGGKINVLEQQLEQTRVQISRAKSAKQDMENLSNELNSLQEKANTTAQQIATLRETKEQINKQKTNQAIKEHYQTLQNDLTNLQNKQQQILALFGNSTPPSSEDLSKLQELQKQFDQTKLMLQNIEQNSNQAKLAELQHYFAGGVPTAEELNLATQKLHDLHTTPATTATNHNNKSILVGACAGFGAICVILAVVLGVLFSSLALGLILGIAGVVLIGIGIVLLLRKSAMSSQDKKTPMNREKLHSELVAFASKYHENTDLLEDSIYSIKLKAQQYAELSQSSQDYTNQKDELIKKAQQYHTTLTEYYSQFFGDKIDFTQNYNDLVANNNKLNFYAQEIKNKQQQIKEFAENKVIPIDDNINNRINEDIDEVVLRKQIVDLEALKETYIDQQTKIISNIDNLSKITDNLAYFTSKEQEYIEQLAEAESQLRIIMYTRQFLTTAQQNLTARYLSPLCDSFTKFATKMLGKQFGQVSIDTDLNILIDKSGSKKETKYFSQGTRDIIELCLRLALVDVLFDGDLPPLILDDPFYNLDDEKTKNAMKLLRELSQELQVIYLVCHSSRSNL